MSMINWGKHIRESADPAKTMAMAADIMRRLIAGEDEQSIAASYGINKSQCEEKMCLSGGQSGKYPERSKRIRS